MRACNVKADERLKQKDNKRKGIKEYGESNDYPQRLLYVGASSHSLQNCLGIYNSFVLGRGIEGFNELKVGDVTGYKLLAETVKDYGIFGGYCYSISYNENGDVVGVYNVPLEYIRLCIDEEGNLTGKYAYYYDWDCKKENKINDEKIVYFYPFNPSKVLEEMELAGGIEFYPGQLFYSNEFVYPMPVYDSVISDIATEDHIATCKYRNAANNFFPAGMLVVKKGQTENDEGTDNDEFSKQMLKFQGSNNLGKIFVAEVSNEDEKPEFVPFNSENFDSSFQYSESSIKQNIGSVFNQPPVLRGELISGKLGTASEIADAFTYYNYITEKIRTEIERNIKYIFSFWYEQLNINFNIIELTYDGDVKNLEINNISDNFLSVLTKNEKRKMLGYPDEETKNAEQPMLATTIGVSGTQSLVEIVTNQILTNEQKKQILIKLFALTNEEATLLIYGNANQ